MIGISPDTPPSPSIVILGMFIAKGGLEGRRLIEADRDDVVDGATLALGVVASSASALFGGGVMVLEGLIMR